jgi:cytochrome P450
MAALTRQDEGLRRSPLNDKFRLIEAPYSVFQQEVCGPIFWQTFHEGKKERGAWFVLGDGEIRQVLQNKNQFRRTYPKQFIYQTHAVLKNLFRFPLYQEGAELSESRKEIGGWIGKGKSVVVNSAETFTRRCLDKVKQREQFDWLQHVVQPVTMAVACRMFKLPPPDIDRPSWEYGEFLRNVQTLGKLLDPPFLYESGDRLRFAEAFINLPKPLLSLLRKSGDERSLENNEKNQWRLIFTVAASLDTTQSLLSNAIKVLDERQDLFDSLKQKPDLIPQFVNEILRLHPPVMILERFAQEDVTLKSNNREIRINKRDQVYAGIGWAGRDPRVISNPTEINLDNQYSTLAFGLGSHQCLGEEVARKEAAAILGVIIEKCDRIGLSHTEDRKPEKFRRFSLQGYRTLPAEKRLVKS